MYGVHSLALEGSQGVTRRKEPGLAGVQRRALGTISITLISTALAFVPSPLVQAQNDPVIQRSRVTGLASFVTDRGAALPTVPGAGRATPTAADFLRQHGHHFGVRDPANELRVARVTVDRLTRQTHTTYEQVHRGVPVFSGVLKVHQDARGQVLAANGDFYPLPATLGVIPTRDAESAVAAARRAMADNEAVAEAPHLVIVDPGWYGDPPLGAHLAYYVVLRNDAAAQAQAFFVDAHSGKILDRWSLLGHARDRKVFDGMGGTTLGVLVRSEGGPPVGSPPDANRAYDAMGDVYGYFLRAFDYDSIDDAGLSLVAVVNSTAPNPCPNAFWTPSLLLTVYCAGLVSDDVVAHEFTHGLTHFSAGFIGQNQPGQLNESFSDVFGELIDLFNGDAGFVGPPSGDPWPDSGLTGPGSDTPNELRGDTCLSGVSLRVNAPVPIAGVHVARAVTNLGPRLTSTGVTGELVLTIPADACPAGQPLSNGAQVAGKIALVDLENRGDCTVVSQAHNAQNAGAIAVVIMALGPGAPPGLNGLDNRIGIPLVTVAVDTADALKAALAEGPVNVTLFANTPGQSVRWLVGEDTSVGAGRDMWNPACFFHPPSANSVLNICGESDGGGVHSGNGVPNHGFAIATDGKTFGGLTVAGIGPIKSGAVWFRALTTYLTPASDFEDTYVALTQSALDLVGTFPHDPRTGFPSDEMFTADDAEQVETALRAVELDTVGRCGASDTVVSSAEPPFCPGRSAIFADDFENGVNGWTVSHAGPAGPPTPYDWVQTTDPLPFDRAGVAWFCADPSIGDCAGQNETAVHTLFSPAFVIPIELLSPTLAFTHYMESEGSADGGNVSIRVNGGAWQLLPRTSVTFNPHNGRFFTVAQGNTHALSGQDAWTGAGGRWGTSIFDLRGFVSGGETLALRFDFAKDGCAGVTGWFVDDVTVYDCPDCDANGLADHEELRFASASPVMGDIGVGSPQTHTLPTPPLAAGDVVMAFTAFADLRSTSESLIVDVNGTVVGTVFTNNATDCNLVPDSETLLVAAQVFNQAVGGGNAAIRIVGNSEVAPTPTGCGGQTYVTVFVDYPLAGGDDNANGILDRCEGDVDGDGDVDLRDAAALFRCFTGPIESATGPCAAADLNADTHVGPDDWALLVGSLQGPR